MCDNANGLICWGVYISIVIVALEILEGIETARHTKINVDLVKHVLYMFMFKIT